jgi:hypothetical protein
MKSKKVLLLTACLTVSWVLSPAMADPVDLDLEGGAVYNLGLIPVSETNDFQEAPFRGMAVSVGQLTGVHPEDGSMITNYYLLLPLMAQSVQVADLVDAGYFVGDGSLLTNLDAGSVTGGRLPVAVLPISGTWDAGGLVIHNASLSGALQGEALTITSNLTVQGVISGDGSGLSDVAAAGEPGAVQFNEDGRLAGSTALFIHEETSRPAFFPEEGNYLRAYKDGTVSDENLILVLRQFGDTSEVVLRRDGQDTIRLQGDGSIHAAGALNVGGLNIGVGDGSHVSFIPAQGDLSMGPFTQP